MSDIIDLGTKELNKFLVINFKNHLFYMDQEISNAKGEEDVSAIQEQFDAVMNLFSEVEISKLKVEDGLETK